ncbi:MAG TPA: hypothetical protein VJ023_11760 [Pyrinomonadaceae bacterium]|nr:hypothetical protein [Pyrinomonadaceae bacterium]
MKRNLHKTLRMFIGQMLGLVLVAGVAGAQEPVASPTQSDDAKTQSSTTQNANGESNYTIVSSIEVGYRGLRVDGDTNKYHSDLNYTAGPRLFDSSFYAKSKDGSGLFDSFLITTTGWGADPNGHLRISMEKPELYRFNGTYRRFKFFRYLNNIANPNFSTRPTDPFTGQHSFDLRNEVGDFDLTILPKNERIRFNVGFSPSRIHGPAFTTWHFGGDDFMLLGNQRSRANDFRVGADWKLGPIDFSFLQGFRRYKDDSTIDNDGVNRGVNPASTNFLLNSIQRDQPIRGSVNYSRFSGHTLLAKKLDITGRLIYSSATTDFNWIETISGLNFQYVRSGLPASFNPPGTTLTLGQWRFVGDTKRPNTLADLGVTYFAADRFRISNTFRVETFQISGGALYNGRFEITKGSVVNPPLTPTGYSHELTKYRKIQNTIEGDYQFNDRYSMRFGYRYGERFIQRFISGHNLTANNSPAIAPHFEEEENHTNAFFGGITARPVEEWLLSLNIERGTADNVFTRTGNYDYTNIKARSRYAVNRNLRFNASFISRDNANPSVITESGTSVSLEDFGVTVKSRTFTSSVDWTVNDKLSFNTGYNYNWQNSNAVIEYAFGPGVPNAGIRGRSLYFIRNNFFYFDTVAQPFRRVSFYAAYRINKDTGQGNRISVPALGTGVLVTSYPMSYQSPEARIAFRLHRRLDWNLGYQYYNYNESDRVRIESPFTKVRPQNYHAHLPYMSLRIYFGRGE